MNRTPTRIKAKPPHLIWSEARRQDAGGDGSQRDTACRPDFVGNAQAHAAAQGKTEQYECGEVSDGECMVAASVSPKFVGRTIGSHCILRCTFENRYARRTLMRSPDRIDPILTKLGALWRANPDLRLTQLVVTLADTGETMPGFLYTEDSVIDEALDRRIADR